MNSEVSIKLGVSPKKFPAFDALIGLFPGMNSLMLVQVRAIAEGFPTLTTFKGFLSCMNP